MRKPAFCICENKGAHQLHGNHAADQRHYGIFATYIVQSLFYLNPKYQAFSYLPLPYSLVNVGPGQKLQWTLFLAQRFNW